MGQVKSLIICLNYGYIHEDYKYKTRMAYVHELYIFFHTRNMQTISSLSMGLSSAC